MLLAAGLQATYTKARFHAARAEQAAAAAAAAVVATPPLGAERGGEEGAEGDGGLAGPSASGRLLASWAAPMELEQSAFVKRAQETARTADYTEVQIDE